MEVGVNLTNPLGRAEQVDLQLEQGSQSTNSFCLSYTRPRFWGRGVADVRLQQVFHSYERWSSFTERVRGCLATVASEDGHHALTYELGWQRLADPSQRASRPVIGQLGDQVKSAARYIFRHETFDNSLAPTAGWGVRSTSEVSGVSPDPRVLRFFKQHLLAQKALPLSGGLTLTLAAEAGVLLPLNGRAAKASPISDRFFLGGLGGAGALRGFSQKGVGPMAPRRPESGAATPAGSHAVSRLLQMRVVAGAMGGWNWGSKVADRLRPCWAQMDSLGGDLFCSLLAAVAFPLPAPALQAAGVHGHVFLNGGNLVGLSRPPGGGSRLHEFSTTFRWSMVRRAWTASLPRSLGLGGCAVGLRSLPQHPRWAPLFLQGAGIVWPTRLGRLELNVCQLLTQQQHDRVKRGLQFGFVPPAW